MRPKVRVDRQGAPASCRRRRRLTTLPPPPAALCGQPHVGTTLVQPVSPAGLARRMSGPLLLCHHSAHRRLPAQVYNQKPWQRRAVQYGLYAIWPLLLLWLISSYPSGSDSGGVTRHTTTGAKGGRGGGVDQTARALPAGGVRLRVFPRSLPALPACQPAACMRCLPAHATCRRAAVLPHLTPCTHPLSHAAADVAGSDAHGAAAGDISSPAPPGEELSDTELHDWELPKGGAGAALGQQLELVTTAGAGSGGAAGGGTADAGRLYSSAAIYVVRNGNGQLAKFYYKFKNVRLTKKFLYFHMPPGGCWVGRGVASTCALGSCGTRAMRCQAGAERGCLCCLPSLSIAPCASASSSFLPVQA